MFFSGRNKQLPYFSDYLTDLVKRTQVDGSRVGVAGAVLGIMGGFTGAAFGILSGTGAIHLSGPALAATILGIQVATFGGIFAYWLSEKRKAEARIANRDLYAEVRAVATQMYASLMRRKLHRDITPTAAAILEEGAHQWTRIQRALDTPFWKDETLAEHWRVIRDHALVNVDRAMLELILLLQTSYQPNSGPQGWQAVMVDVVEQLGGTVHIERGDDMLPVTFDQAQHLLLMMAELATEVENASRDLISAGVEQADDKLRSRLAIGQTLQELRSVREAEEELRRNLGGP